MNQRQPKHYIQSLARGVKLLEAFSIDRPYLTLQELADAGGLTKTTAQRLTDTLMTLGYLGRDEHKRFFLEPHVLGLGFAYLHGSELRHAAAPLLDKLADRIGQTVNLSVLDGGEVLFIYRREVNRFFDFGLKEGSRLPAHCTSSGKVLLAGLPAPELGDRLDQMDLEPLTDRTITDRSVLEAELAETRRRGYGVSDREGSLALFSAAVPVWDRRGRVAAAINISLPADLGRSTEATGHIKEMIAAGWELSQKMGYWDAYPWPGEKGFVLEEL